jgi:hypothetical protein
LAQLRIFTIEEERYLLNQMIQSDHKAAQRTLQGLCESLREGRRFIDPKPVRDGLRVCLTSPHLAIRRWALNVAAIVGLGGDHQLILDQLGPATNDPDLMASVVGALFAQAPSEASRLLDTSGAGVDGANLIAAAQFSDAERTRLVETKIPIDTASTPELKAGLVLTGTGKAPENLFFASHKNKVALEQLNLHPVPSVSKYSIWALAKLRFGFDSLRIPLSEFDSSVPEVRKWVLRLLFSDSRHLSKNLEMVERASRDDSEEVRHESAIELRNIFVSGLDHYILAWFFLEPYAPARDALMEHMAANSEKAPDYWEVVTTIYEREPFGSQQRTRLEAASAGTTLYGALRRIAIKGELPRLLPDERIFGGGPVTNIKNTFGEGSNFGALSFGGDVNTATINAINSVQHEPTKQVLQAVLAFINVADLNPGQKAEGAQLVREAAGEPTKTRMQKLIGYLKTIGGGAQAAGSAVAGVDGLIDKVQSLPMFT